MKIIYAERGSANSVLQIKGSDAAYSQASATVSKRRATDGDRQPEASVSYFPVALLTRLTLLIPSQ